MNYTGQNLIDRARFVLMDAGATAWTAPELEGWLNDARSRTYELRPDLFVTDGNITLVGGSVQSVPDSSKRLVSIDHNVSARSKRQITLTDDETLARFRPGWRAMKQSTEILHYLYDEGDGAEFEVYPPAVAGTVVYGEWCNPPEALASLSDPLTIEGELAIAYVDYILHRAFQKESDSNPGFSERANLHLGLYQGALESEVTAKVTSSPNAQREGGRPPVLGR